MKFKLSYITAALIFGSCAKIDLVPDGINTTANLFQSQKDAEAAVNGMYTSLTSHDLYNQFSETMQSQGTDDAEWGNGRNTQNAGKLAIDKFTFNASTDVIYRHWQIQYRVINRANLTIASLAPMEIDEAKKRQYMGEAHFLRGMMYFNLVRLFGPVPMPLTPTQSLENLNLPQATVPELFAQVVADFSAAKEMLPEVYGGADLGRATKGAAMAMLAKTYLTNHEYENAATEAQAVLDMGLYSLWPSYADVFRIENKNRRESIFEVQYVSTGAAGGGFGSSYAGFFRPSAAVVRPPDGRMGGNGDNPVTLNHFEAYGSGDLRRDVNVMHVPTAPSSIRYPYYVNKYQDPNALTLDDGGNNYMIVRLADVMLMLAEALHETNPGDARAYELVNRIRRRAYGENMNAPSPHDLASGLSVEQFRDSVLLERRLELAFEGHRRFDLLRTGKLKEAMNAQDPAILVEDRHLLLPIPQDELIVNKELKQNPGY